MFQWQLTKQKIYNNLKWLFSMLAVLTMVMIYGVLFAALIFVSLLILIMLFITAGITIFALA